MLLLVQFMLKYHIFYDKFVNKSMKSMSEFGTFDLNGF